MSDKLAIIRDVESPPGGWRYTVPETNVTITASFTGSLKRKITAHLEANGLPVPSDADLEDGICRESGHGEPWCGGAKVTVPESPLLNLASVNRFLRTVLQAVKDRKFVDAAERERRLAICAACPALTTVGVGCRGCNQVMRAVMRVIPIETNAPEVCSRCGCLTSVKSFVELDTLKKADGTSSPAYESGCWMLD